jgi:hypothetical protein
VSNRARSASTADPRALRALAHPVRWKLIDILAGEGSVTAKRCAEVLGESTATCSYHLGILAKYGYITRVASREWREKPWRLVSEDLDLSQPGLGQEGAAGSRAAAAALVDYTLTWLKENLERNQDEALQWQHTNKIMSATAWVTAEQSQQVALEVQKILDEFAAYGHDETKRSEGARRVRLFAAIALAPPSMRFDDQ